MSKPVSHDGAYKLRLKRSAFVLALIVMPLLLLGTLQFFTLPAKNNAETADAALQAASTKLAQEQAMLNSVKTSNGAQARALLAWDTLLDEALPPTLVSSGYAEIVERVAAETGVSLTGLSPVGSAVEMPQTPGKYQEFQMAVSGDAAALTRFFGRLAELNPLSVVSNVNITVGGVDSNTGSSAAGILRGFYATAPTLGEERQADDSTVTPAPEPAPAPAP